MMATLVQFHHHDYQGNVYWHLTLSSDVELSSNGCSIEQCHIDDISEQCHHNADQHKACPMHIGAAMVSDHIIATPPILEIDNAIIVVDSDIIPQCEIYNTRYSLWKDGNIGYINPVITSYNHRGPPIYNA
jgi:hypothetical protein